MILLFDHGHRTRSAATPINQSINPSTRKAKGKKYLFMTPRTDASISISVQHHTPRRKPRRRRHHSLEKNNTKATTDHTEKKKKKIPS
mmetsp:Transcript_7031/g.23024  ORF Transcript_7031/g.23024 Transcript_7031/m.23024 type:complete len:88 (+) Transcript_7031:1437-1700(+)